MKKSMACPPDLPRTLNVIESVKVTSMQNESTRVLYEKHYLIHENKVNENKVLSYCEASRFPKNGTTYRSQVVRGTKHRKNNQLQSVELLCRISW